MHSLLKTLFWLTIFSIAMGFLETAVVVYLRKLYYPEGFHFPLVQIPPDIAWIEGLREAATILMLLGAGMLAGKKGAHRFAFFVYAFAVWDIFYYVFLKLLINWPESWQTRDILFLLPVPWVGPVIAPCIVAASMLLLTLSILFHSARGYHTQILLREWLLFCSGSLVVIWAFCADYMHHVVFGNKPFWALSGDKKLFSDLRTYVPVSFNWSLFTTGEVMLLLAIFLYTVRIRKRAHGEESMAKKTTERILN
jgi:hypothetical protein